MSVAQRSTLLGGTTIENILLADRLQTLYCLPKWRFMNSGTEATRDAIQIARAFTGRSEIIKIEGAYHGQHESVCVSFQPPLDSDIGPRDCPKPLISHSGIPKEISDLTRIIPFNCSKQIIESQIAKSQTGIACIIVEPILMNCGMIVPRAEFLSDLRQVCSEHNTILIFDEVKTNTTIGIGGVVQHFGINPDIVCLGKSCSGGIPFGAIGVNEELGSFIASGEVSVNSTFGGNLLAVSCCLTTLNEIMIPAAYERLERVNFTLKTELERLLQKYLIPGLVSIQGAKGCLLFMDHEPIDYRDWKENHSHALSSALHSFLLNNGIWMSGPGEEWTLSVAHSDEDISMFIQCVDQFFARWTNKK
jgi:glutamate-1-semialdehyde 2,1-aminomutase